MVYYRSITKATLADVLSELATEGINKNLIINIFPDGTDYTAVYIVNA